MSTLLENLERLETAKTDIAEAIVNKGVEVAEGEGFESFAEKIDGIPTGGSPDWFGNDGYSIKRNAPFVFGSKIIYNNEIHAIAAIDAKSGSKYTEHYKWNGTSWVKVSTLPYNPYDVIPIVYNNEIHIFGGNLNYTSATEHYKWNGTSWVKVSTLPYKFYRGSAVVMNGELHIIGGSFNTTSSNPYGKNHYKWNGTSWVSVSTLPYEFSQGTAFVYNDEIHILGAHSSSYRTRHYIFKENKWISSESTPYNITTSNGHLNEIVINGKIGFIIENNVAFEWDGTKWNIVDNPLLIKNRKDYIQYNDYLVEFMSSSTSDLTYECLWCTKKMDWE